MASDIDIANAALDIIHGRPITSFEDERDEARIIGRSFALIRDAVLREFPWNFASARAALPEKSEKPAFGFNHAYPIPNDCLRVIKITDDFEEEEPVYKIEGGEILTNASAPLKVQYTKRVTNAQLFDPIFAEALAARIAMKIGHSITGKKSFAEMAENQYRDALQSAMVVDGQEGTPERPVRSHWLDHRGL